MTLKTILKMVLAPYKGREPSRITVEGDDTPIGRHAFPTIALALYELATNAAKYGGLASASAKSAVSVAITGELNRLTWRETGAPGKPNPGGPEGFGSRLKKTSVTSLHGSIERHWQDRGFEIVLQFPVGDLSH